MPPTPPPTKPPTPPPTTPPTPPPLPYDCDKTSYTCAPKAGGAFTTKSTCMAYCIMPPPTPPPTPAVMYKCDSSTGQCLPSAQGAQTAAQCAGSCVCEIPHNCGQLNGTYVCGKKINACNVCDECCEFYVLPQANCNECVAQAAPPAGKGCGWPNMTDLFQLART